MSRTEKLDKNRLGDEAERLKAFLESRVINQERAIRKIANHYNQFLSPLRRRDRPITRCLFLGPSGVGKTYIVEVLAEYFFGDPTAFTKAECGSYQEKHEVARLIGAPPGYVGYEDTPLLAQTNIDKPDFEFRRQALENDPETQRLNEELVKAWEELPDASEVQHLTEELAEASEKYSSVDSSTPEEEVQKRKRRLNDAQRRKEEFRKRSQRFKDAQRRLEKVSAQKMSASLRTRPRISIVLFDEIEKSNQALHHFLLEMTDKGRCRLANGKETLFYNTFTFMTSNAGSESIAEILSGKSEIGFGKDDTKKARKTDQQIYAQALKELRKLFGPEFLGRIEDEIVVFHSLSAENLAQIRDKLIGEIYTDLAQNFPIELVIDDVVKNLILKESLDHPEYGARLLKSKVQKMLKAPIDRLINSGQIAAGDKIIVTLEDGEVMFKKEINEASDGR